MTLLFKSINQFYQNDVEVFLLILFSNTESVLLQG